jgi:hypothetical protein
VAFAHCGSETIRVSLADVRRRRHGGASRQVMSMPVRDRAVQRAKHRVRCAWRWWCPFGTRTRSGGPVCVPGTMLRRSGHTVTWSRRDRWRGHVRGCDARGARGPREGLVADGRTHRRSSPHRDAGPSLRACDIWFRHTPVRACALSIRSSATPDEVLLMARRRSALRDPRRRRARVRIHPVRPGREPSGTGPGSGGAPA